MPWVVVDVMGRGYMLWVIGKKSSLILPIVNRIKT